MLKIVDEKLCFYFLLYILKTKSIISYIDILLYALASFLWSGKKLFSDTKILRLFMNIVIFHFK